MLSPRLLVALATLSSIDGYSHGLGGRVGIARPCVSQTTLVAKRTPPTAPLGAKLLITARHTKPTMMVPPLFVGILSLPRVAAVLALGLVGALVKRRGKADAETPSGRGLTEADVAVVAPELAMPEPAPMLEPEPELEPVLAPEPVLAVATEAAEGERASVPHIQLTVTLSPRSRARSQWK